VLTARKLEGGIRFGLGSTLATTKTVLAAAGGLEPLVEYLADDYEMGARIATAGYLVELADEVVETAVPAYSFRGFADHQLRWARSTRDSRRLGYLGLGVTFCLPWAILACIASGFALWSFTLLSVAALARVSVALAVGVGVLRDGQVLRDLWLLPLRDVLALGFWAWSFAGDTVVWRGERFHLHDGRLRKAGHLADAQ
jgi:ceramide glucosyltransferase